MSRSSYLIRLLIGSAGAVVMTFAIGMLVMWMNGFIVEDEPSTVALTPCIFGESSGTSAKDPFARETIELDCVAPEEEKPLFTQWFDSILSRRASESGAPGAAGG